MERNNRAGAPRQALVIGGGLAGPMVGLALRKLGIEVTVFDDREKGAGAVEGAWLTVAVNGLDALRTLGVADAVMAAGFPSESIELASGDGTVLGRVPLGGALSDGTTTHTVARAALHAVLVSAAEDAGVAFVYERRLSAIEEGRDGVTARFADGSEAHGAFLVGADGIFSTVRRLIDPQARGPHYNGLGNVGGFTPRGDLDVPEGTYRMVFGARGFFGFTLAPGMAPNAHPRADDVWWFANPPRAQALSREELAARTDEQVRDELIAMFADDVGPMAPLIRGARGKLVAANQQTLPTAHRWTRGRVVLVGDAAHAASPSSGQGASMAAEDAVELARCLRDVPSLEQAFATFESLRRPRAEAIIAHAARYESKKALGPIGVYFRDRLLPFVLRRTAQDTAALAWLYDHHIDWDARVSPNEGDAMQDRDSEKDTKLAALAMGWSGWGSPVGLAILIAAIGFLLMCVGHSGLFS